MKKLRQFIKATNPAQTLNIKKPEDANLYINFASVRGGEIIDKIKKRIFLYDDEPSCTLFTGHIGCGKSTELLRLKAQIEDDGFHVVYFESSEDLDMTDIDIADILLVIAKRIAESLSEANIKLKAKGFKKFLKDTINILNAEITAIKGNIPIAGEVGVNIEDENFSVSFGIGEITRKVKNDSNLRKQLNQYLAPRKVELLNQINNELILPAIAGKISKEKQV